MTRPRRLRRSIDAPGDMFTLSGTDDLEQSDDTITSLTINRGSDDPGGGVRVSTLEAEVLGTVRNPYWTGANVSLKLTPAAAEWISARSGRHRTAATLAPRFTGRVGPIEVNDTGNVHTSTTRLDCSSWIAQENTSRHVATISAGTKVNAAIRRLLNRAPDDYTLRTEGTWDELAVRFEEATFSDDIAKLTSDFGILVADMRDGSALAKTLPIRISQALERVDTTIPLTRSQAISPATWRQQLEATARKFQFTMIGADGQPFTRTRYDRNTVSEDAVTEEIDWTHIKTVTDHWDYAADATAHRNNIRRFSLPRIRVDLLRLLNSDHDYHRVQAGELLALNTGDTVNLSHDWTEQLRGIHVVTGMTENITGDSWELELSLVPMLHALGAYPPEIPALVWESALYRWTNETRIWAH